MARGAAYYNQIGEALNGLNQQLNVNADRDLVREDIGLRRLSQHHQMLLNLQQAKRQQEMHDESLKEMKTREERAVEAQGWARQQFQLSLPGLQFKNLQFKNAMDKSPVNVGKWFSQTPMLAEQLRSNVGLQNSIASIYGEGTKLDPKTLNVLGPDGKPLIASGYEQALTGPMLVGAIESNIDPQQALTMQQGQLNSQLQSLQKAYKNTGNHDVGQKAELAKNIAQIKSQLAQTGQQLNPMSLLQFHQRKDKLLTAASTIAAANMLPPAYINMLSNAQAQNQRSILELQKHLFDTQNDKLQGGQKMAVKIDPNTNQIVQGSGMVLTIPKERRGFSPDEIDPRLKGYIWSDEVSNMRKSGEGYAGWKQAKYLDERYGKMDSTGQWYIAKENQGRRTNAGLLTTDLRNKYPNEDPLKMAQTAKLLADEYHNKAISDIERANTDPDFTKKQRAEAISLAKKKFNNLLKEEGLLPYDPAPNIK